MGTPVNPVGPPTHPLSLLIHFHHYLGQNQLRKKQSITFLSYQIVKNF